MMILNEFILFLLFAFCNFRDPNKQAIFLFNKFLKVPFYHPKEHLAIVETINYSDIVNLTNSDVLFRGLSFISLIQGNVVEEDVYEMLQILNQNFIEKVVENKKTSMVSFKVVNLNFNGGEKPVRILARQMAVNTEEKNNSVFLSFQVKILIKKIAFLFYCIN